MIKLQVLSAELNLWANETEQVYRATKDIKYRRDAVHMRYLAATLNQSTNDGGNTTSNVLIDGGGFITASENVLVDAGSFI